VPAAHAHAPAQTSPAAPGADALSAVFLALADPTRRAMIDALSRGERTLTELAAPFQISVPAVNKHLRMLERAGLVRRGRAAQRKPCTLQAQPLREARDWIEQHRAEWEARLDRLDALVLALHAAEQAAKQAGEPASGQAAEQAAAPAPGRPQPRSLTQTTPPGDAP